MTVALTGEQLIALGGDKLDDWTVDDNDILISPGNESGTRKIRFASLGSYYTHHHLTLFLYVLVPLIWINEKAEFVAFPFWAALVLIVLSAELLKYYKKTSCVLDGEGIRINDGGSREHILPYREITKAEKKIFHINVSTKNGETLHFPGAWILLPELIKKFAALSNNAKSSA